MKLPPFYLTPEEQDVLDALGEAPPVGAVVETNGNLHPADWRTGVVVGYRNAKSPHFTIEYTRFDGYRVNHSVHATWSKGHHWRWPQRPGSKDPKP